MAFRFASMAGRFGSSAMKTPLVFSRRFTTTRPQMVKNSSWLLAGAGAAVLAGLVYVNREMLIVHAAQAAPQPSVVSGGRDHAGYVWIHLAPNANAKQVAAVAAHLQDHVNELAPQANADDDDKILAGVAFGPAFWKKLNVGGPTWEYKERKHAVGDMPSTGGDVFFHIKSNHFPSCFELTELLLKKFPSGSIANVETNYGFVYKNGRDLSGFIDGTENPAAEEDRVDAAISKDAALNGGSFLITQRWEHRADMIANTPTADQEGFVGRTKDNSVELKDKPATSHVARMVGQDKNGKKINIVRQSMPYVRGETKGLFFIAYSSEVGKFDFMLDRMTGNVPDKLHDNIMRFTKCVSGNFWYVPSTAELAKLR